MSIIIIIIIITVVPDWTGIEAVHTYSFKRHQAVAEKMQEMDIKAFTAIAITV